MEKIKLAYFGSPNFAADFLKKLITDTTINQLIEVRLVITQSDQPVGRKQILTPTPVKQVALKHNLEIHDLKLIENFKLKIKNFDLCLVYAYGDLIPKELLDQPKYGFWNIHPSLLPKYRGPSPIATPLINGDKITGVTIIKMDEEIDHGPIISQEKLTIAQNDSRPDLENKLTDLGFIMFKGIVKNVFLGSKATPESLFDSGQARMTTISQQHQSATFTKKLSKQDGFIEFENLKLKIKNSPEVLYNLFRGLSPWPGIWTSLPNDKRLKITDLSLVDGKLIINKVQLEGKNEVDFETFNKAYKIFDVGL